MSRSAAISVENNLSKGLITEASGLNFPEDAVTETFNCIYKEDASVIRRFGIDYEEDYTLFNTTSSSTDQVVVEYRWESVGNNGNVTLVVVQFGSTLYFYNTSLSANLSSNKKSFSVSLDTYKVAGAPSTATAECQFSSGNGHLFVVHPFCEPFYITYTIDTDTITSAQINIKIRDQKGIDNDGTTSDADRPTTLTNKHKYNLYNQGWFDQVKTATASQKLGSADDEGNLLQLLDYWDNSRSDYPANSEVWWLLKASNDLVDIRLANRTSYRGDTPAPKGHYKLNPFFEDRSSASGISGLTVVNSSYFRPSTVGFFASRVFYAGTNYQGYGSKIYYSQIIESEDQYGKCYQKEDPTAETLSDLLATDGGVILIPDIGTVIRLFATQQALFVFASNGVWAISGSNNGPFLATDYTIQNISNIESLDSKNFVNIGGSPTWWNNSGIYTITFDTQTFQFQAKSLTDTTIKTFFQDIPLSSKYYAKGSFNQLTNTIKWLYRNETASSLLQNYFYDRVLILNLTLGAFYPYTISELDSVNGPFVSGIITTKGLGLDIGNETVTDSTGATVVDSGGDIVVTEVASVEPVNSEDYYLTIFKNSTFRLTFSKERDANYVDWVTQGVIGVDYSSYLFTGYKVHGQAIKKFQSNYIQVFLKSQLNASLYLNVYWDYTNSGNSGRVSSTQQCYNNVFNYDIVTRRLLIRGSGLSAQLKFTSELGKPFQLIGWSSFETGNNLP